MRPISLGHGFLRFATGLRGFLRSPISIRQAKAIIESRMRERENAFLALVRSLLARPQAPYGRLFRAAGCEFGDVEALIAGDGLDATLSKLADAGVYITADEFKGRADDGRDRRVRSGGRDFDNPLARPAYRITTSGSHGRAVRIPIDVDWLAQRAPLWAVWFESRGWLGRPLIFYTPHYAGIANRQLICAKFGHPFSKWFVSDVPTRLADRIPALAVHATLRKAAGFPRPEVTNASTVARTLANLGTAGSKPCVVTTVSGAVRVSRAAWEGGSSLRGTSFIVGSEPITPAAARAIEEAGGVVAATYGSAETGTIGLQCGVATEVDDIHVARDSFAVIRRPQKLGDVRRGHALFVTSLLPTSPKVMLNVDVGDTAVLESRRCTCLFDELGYVDHLYKIRSYQKLTGEGVTILGTDLYETLGTTLPDRFGGTLSDYQLIEERDGNGLTRYRLLVSPEIGEIDEGDVVAVLLGEIGKMGRGYRMMAAQWARAGLVQVQRRRPFASPNGKVVPFRTFL